MLAKENVSVQNNGVLTSGLSKNRSRLIERKMKTAMPLSGYMSMSNHNRSVMPYGNSCTVSSQELRIFSLISEKYVLGGGVFPVNVKNML
ncbi:MAG: hypothetical protein LBK22_02560, partial [Tannerella sp.]|jgi:hypothetical protein|nr:hypothetical protein [Tannerella sp.]